LNEQPEEPTKRSMWRKIRLLDIPEAAREKLRALWYRAKELANAIVNWIYQRKEFCASVLLGVALAYLLGPLPFVGPVLGALSISLSVLYGIVAQFRADLDRHFKPFTQAQPT
jgi:hypothetical protein